MGGAHDVWSRCVDRGVDHVGCCVQEPAWSAIDDFAVVVDKDEIGGFDQGECNAEWVDPECRRVNWVLKNVRNDLTSSQRLSICLKTYAKGDMAGNSLIEAKFTEDAKSSRKSSLEIRPLLVRVIEFGWARKFELHLCFFL